MSQDEAPLAAAPADAGVKRVINPYLRSREREPSRMTVQLQPLITNNVTININPCLPFQDNNPRHTMPQSQWRKSSVTQCKQKASLFRGPHKYRISHIERACRVCKVKTHNKQIELQIQAATAANASPESIRAIRARLKSIPHRAHIQNCPANKSKKKIPQSNFNNTVTLPPSMLGANSHHIHNDVSPNGTSRMVDETHRERWKSTPLASELRSVLQTRMQNSAYMDKLKTCRAPPAVAVLVDYIYSTFVYSRPEAQNLPDSDIFVERYDQYRRFFQPGSIAFVFPPERRDRVPFPQYHAIEGTT
jgi:hypothetical protein